MAQSIGDVAAHFGLTLRTLRFYEDRGLLSPERRGFTRLYHARDVETVAFISQMTRYGFSLSEIKLLLLQSRRAGSPPILGAEQAHAQLHRLEQQVQQVNEAIKGLKSLCDSATEPKRTARPIDAENRAKQSR